MLSDALRAVIVALSIVTCAIILSDIIEEEELLVERGKGEKLENNNNVVQATSDEFHGVTMHDQILTGEIGNFESPNYPNADHKLDCIWIIRVDPNNTVRLVVNEFDTEKDFDFLFVHDGDTAEHPLLLAHSGSSKPHPIRSTSNEMLVRFVTNNKISSRGFQAKYQSAPPCYTAAQFSNGLISSPNYPNQYDNNVRCDWLITVGPSEVILLELMEVDTEENQDFIEIFDGETDQAPLLQKLSGDYRENVLFLSSTTNAVLLRFTSDCSVSKSGFAIKFTAGSDNDLLTYAAKEFQGYYDEPATTEAAPTGSAGPTEPPQENARIRQRSRIAELMKASNMTL